MANATHISRPRLFLALAALFLSSICTMGDLVINPIVANVYEAFADAPLWLVNLGITGPALVGLPFGLLAGYLCDRVDKRIIMVAGFAIFTLSSVFGILYVNVWYFVVMRLLATGIGWGITNTAAFAILADLFTDDTQHARYVGWYNACMSVLGALLASASGFLAVGGWVLSYRAYWLAVPVLAMLVAFLPSFPPKTDTFERVEAVHGESRSSAGALGRAMNVARTNEGGATKKWWVAIVPLTVQVFFVALLYYIILYLVGVYVSDKGLGDEAFTGLLTSILTISTAIGSIAFGFFYKALKNKVYIPGLLAIAAAFFILSWTDSQIVAAMTLALAGLGWAFYFCFFYTYCTELVPNAKNGMATSVVAASNGLAVSASSQTLTYAMAATGLTSFQLYPAFGCVMLVVLVLSVLWGIYRSWWRRCAAV